MDIPQLLLVEDSKSLAMLYTGFLGEESCKVIRTDSGKDAIRIIADASPSVIVLDLHLPDINGFEVLDYIQKQRLPSSVIVVTGTGSVDKAVEAMRRGAIDFIEKPVAADRLIVTVRNALERNRLARLVQSYEKDRERSQYEGFVGSSAAMQDVYDTIDRAAPSTAAVFVTGESGTGKELCAHAIHAKSARRENPFVVLNCAAIAPDLVESEIFGHVKGSFTGATADRDGAATTADGGTLFLDEICEMRLDLQSKLLRLIQTGGFQKVGSSKTTKVDIRFVCATNRSPYDEVRAGRFREDLLHRLHVIPINLPPLRDRNGDVLVLAKRFLAEFSKQESKVFESLSNNAAELILTNRWPGNVRELQNVIRRVVILNAGEVITSAMLRRALADNGNTRHPNTHTEDILPLRAERQTACTEIAAAGSILSMSTVKQQAIERAVRICDGNIVLAAAQLGINPSTIYRCRSGKESG